jgi:WD40 repeat protein
LATCAVGGRALMVSGAEDYTVRLWDVETGSMLKVLKGHLDYVSAVATCMAVGLGDADVTGGRVVILSGSDDKSVRLWEAETGTLLRVLAVPATRRCVCGPWYHRHIRRYIDHHRRLST